MPLSKSLSEQVFDTRDFFRTLSYREFVTALTLILLLLSSIYSLVYLYEGNEDVRTGITFVFILIIGLLNHFFYRLEHRRPNNFIGRILVDYLFCIIGYLIAESFSWFFSGGFFTEIPTVGTLIVVVLQSIICITIFELIVAGLKRLFMTIGWQPI